MKPLNRKYEGIVLKNPLNISNGAGTSHAIFISLLVRDGQSINLLVVLLFSKFSILISRQWGKKLIQTAASSTIEDKTKINPKHIKHILK